MATPHVAGAAALLLQRSPLASAAQIINELKTVATSGVVDGLAEGSPNLLLYVRQDDPATTITTTSTSTTNGCMSSGMWSICAGPCLLDSFGCVRSPNFPSQYTNGHSCDIRINAGEASPILVEAFATEANYDIMVVNNVQYSGDLGQN